MCRRRGARPSARQADAPHRARRGSPGSCDPDHIWPMDVRGSCSGAPDACPAGAPDARRADLHPLSRRSGRGTPPPSRSAGTRTRGVFRERPLPIPTLEDAPLNNPEKGIAAGALLSIAVLTVGCATPTAGTASVGVVAATAAVTSSSPAASPRPPSSPSPTTTPSSSSSSSDDSATALPTLTDDSSVPDPGTDNPADPAGLDATTRSGCRPAVPISARCSLRCSPSPLSTRQPRSRSSGRPIGTITPPWPTPCWG